MVSATWVLLLLLLSFVLLAAILWLAFRLNRAQKDLHRAHCTISAQRKYRVLAYSDILTGLPNRLSFQEQIEQLENSGRMVCIASLDLNNLKHINDTCGHAEGDLLLQQTATHLRTACVPHYQVFRVGGDEFVLLGHGQTHEQANQFLSHLKQELKQSGLDLALGWAVACAHHPGDLKQLFLKSDQNMYHNKRECHINSPGC